MKLQQLDIQAFGPFATKETIDFSRLGDNALFLIDGPTGAGKSSILHAICFALYGETTDTDRKALGLRCDHAPTELLTELTLQFSIRDVHYQIHRVPAQMRPAKRGGGETEQKASAHLCRILDDGEQQTIVAKKVSEAGEQIKQIVGLTAEQFLQVMVLPQGKFRQLLIAKSDERQQILSTLFQTEIYKEIEQNLKNKAAEIEKKHQAYEARKQDAFADVQVTDEQQLTETITMASQQLAEKLILKQSAAKQLQQVQTEFSSADLLVKSFLTLQQKTTQLANHIKQKHTIDMQKQRYVNGEQAVKIKPQWQSLVTVNDELKQKTTAHKQTVIQLEQNAQQLTQSAQALKQAQQDYLQRDSLVEKQKLLTQYQHQLAEFESLQQRHVSTQSAYQTGLEQKTGLITKQTSLNATQLQLAERTDEINRVIATKSALVEQRAASQQCLDLAKQRQQIQTQLTQQLANETRQQQQLQQTQQHYKQAEYKANEVEMHWFANQAAVLAAKLEPQQACAVCGSLDHPQPAQFVDNEYKDLSQQRVDQARKVQADCQQQMSAAETQLQALSHQTIELQQQVINLTEKLAANADKSLIELEAALHDLSKKIADIDQQQQQLAQLNQQKVQQHNELNIIATQLHNVDVQLPMLNSAFEQAKNQLQTAVNSVPENYQNRQVITNEQESILININLLESKLKVATDNNVVSLTQQSSLQASLTQLNLDMQQLSEKESVLTSSWQQALLESGFVNQANFEQALLTDNEMIVLSKQIASYDNTVTSLQTEISLLQQQLTDKVQPDLIQLQLQVDNERAQFKLADEAWLQTQQQLNLLEKTQLKLKKIEQEQEAIKQEYEVVGTLAKAATGRGNVRVSLERFVLGNILDSVLSIASQRLYIMSKGQYRLIRQNEQVQKRNTTAGLDLAIDDAHTGKTRPVATLSGGESFLASLALALGLSDVVQERSGGIQLDTLFIDEGFGSLDQESLQLAINTLVDLQSTGRSIGIISHVSELKEQMAQRIEVTGSVSGSSIRTLAN